jgi:hypothetical protein
VPGVIHDREIVGPPGETREPVGDAVCETLAVRVENRLRFLVAKVVNEHLGDHLEFLTHALADVPPSGLIGVNPDRKKSPDRSEPRHSCEWHAAAPRVIQPARP